jgi:hypothetical protein
MKELAEIFKMLGSYGPQYVILAFVIFTLWKSGAMKEMFSSRASFVSRSDSNAHINVLQKSLSDAIETLESIPKRSEFVLRADCHGNIEALQRAISETRADLKEHINGVDEKVNILLKAAIK